MRRALSAWLATMLGCAATGRAEVRREVFPVPPVVDAAFRGGGLAAFDPFDPWEGDDGRPAVALKPAIPGDDATGLPAGFCYDVLPAWTARGFKPHAGTRVLYHPQTQLLFATMAAEDEAQVRVFCDWPPSMWMSTAYWNSGWSVYQVLYRVTSYSVPATGPGGWSFQPATVNELLALPAEARRMLERKSMVIRGGQRSKIEGYATPPHNRYETLTGMTVEAECTVGEDGWTIDLNNAPDLAVRLDDGSRAALSSIFQQLIGWGDSWLMEAGTLPGNPQRRIFQAFETLRVHGEVRDARTFARHVQRWTGRAVDEQTSGEALQARALYLLDFPRPLLPLPLSAPPADPFATPEPVKEEPLDPPATLVPELFGEVPVQDMSAALAEATGVKAGELQAWRTSGDSTYYIRGSPDGMAALARWLEDDPYGENMTYGTAMAEATVRLLPPGGAGDGKILWRGTIPVRSGQRSGFRFTVGDKKEDDDAPFACFLEIEAGCDDPTDPIEDGAYVWSLTAGGSLRPPLVDFPVNMATASELGTRHGATLRRYLAHAASGEEIVLTINLREVPFRSLGGWTPRPLHEWWWRRQLAKAAKK